MLEQLIQKALQKIKQDYAIVFKPGDEERFLKTCLENKSIQERNGLIVSAKTGVKIDSDNFVLDQLKNGNFLKAKSGLNGYVAPWKKPSEETFQAQKTHMRNHFARRFEIENIHFVDDAIKGQILEALSENFIASENNEYHKVNQNGLFSTKTFSFDELLSQTRAAKFIDHDKSKVYAALHQSKIAAQFQGLPKSDQDRMIESLKKLELRGIPKGKIVPKLDIDLNAEFKKQAFANMGIFAERATLDQKRHAEFFALSEIDSLNDVSELASQISLLKEPAPQTWSTN